MGITISWGNAEKTVILQVFDGRWTWEEFYNTGRQIQTMIREVDHEVHVLSDMTNSGALPVGGAISHANNMMKQFPENGGLLIIISDKLFIRSMANTFSRVFSGSVGEKVRAAATIEEAYQLIAQADDNGG